LWNGPRIKAESIIRDIAPRSHLEDMNKKGTCLEKYINIEYYFNITKIWKHFIP